MSDDIAKLKALLKPESRVLILAHLWPDPDACCSLAATSLFLRNAGHHPYAYTPGPIMRGLEYLTDPSVLNTIEPPDHQWDLIIVLDTANKERIGGIELIPEEVPVIMIDHHGYGKPFGDIRIVDEHAASATQVLAEIAPQLEWNITPEIANILYTGLYLDCGGFMHSSVTPQTFHIASSLIDTPLTMDTVNRAIRKIYTPEDIAFLTTLCSNIQFEDTATWAWVADDHAPDNHHLSQVNLIHDELLTNVILRVQSCSLAILFTYLKPRLVRVNLRSTAPVNCAEIVEPFGGGGHAQSAGVRIEGTIDEVTEKVHAVVRNTLRTNGSK